MTAFFIPFHMKLMLVLFLFGHLVNGQNLDHYLWKNRVILLFDSSSQLGEAKAQLKVLNSAQKELIERDVIVLQIPRNEQVNLLQQLKITNDFSGLVLLGKDGGVKLKQRYVVETKTLFALIDAMPMRRAEMQQKFNQQH